MDGNEPVTQEQMLANVFNQLDTNNSGRLDTDELKRALAALGLAKAGVSTEQVLAVLDADSWVNREKVRFVP